jgi:hypothetical protein
VITGVFVESALESDAEEKDAHMVERLLNFMANGDNPGMTTLEEFEHRLEDPVLCHYFDSCDVDPGEARGLFKLLDANGSGVIDSEEFIMGCLRLRGNAKAIDLATIMYENRRWNRRLDNKLAALAGVIGGLLPAEQQQLPAAAPGDDVMKKQTGQPERSTPVADSRLPTAVTSTANTLGSEKVGAAGAKPDIPPFPSAKPFKDDWQLEEIDEHDAIPGRPMDPSRPVSVFSA